MVYWRGGIAHDFNNLLSIVLGNADMSLANLFNPSTVRENLREIVVATEKAKGLAGQMLDYSGTGNSQVAPVSVAPLIEEMAQMLKVSISKKSNFKVDVPGDLPSFIADSGQVSQVIMNLILNAAEAQGERGGTITLSAGTVECDQAYIKDANERLGDHPPEPVREGTYVYIDVADGGCGMSPETVSRIFDPFFTTKDTGRGLGMSALLGIVRGHQGLIKIQTEIGKGTRIRILFPAMNSSKDTVAPALPPKPAVEKWRGKGTVLIADDEVQVRNLFGEMLKIIGFDVLLAEDGQAAVSAFSQHCDDIVCVLLDMTMPGMGGEETYQELRRLRPDVLVIFCSGYSDTGFVSRQLNSEMKNVSFLKKPFSMSELKTKMMTVLNATAPLP